MDTPRRAEPTVPVDPRPLRRTTRSIACKACGDPVTITVVTALNVDVAASVDVRDVHCPKHLSAEKRDELERVKALRPAEKRGEPLLAVNTKGGPCRLCGVRVAVRVEGPEGTTWTIASGETRKHTDCTPANAA